MINFNATTGSLTHDLCVLVLVFRESPTLALFPAQPFKEVNYLASVLARLCTIIFPSYVIIPLPSAQPISLILKTKKTSLDPIFPASYLSHWSVPFTELLESCLSSSLPISLLPPSIPFPTLHQNTCQGHQWLLFCQIQMIHSQPFDYSVYQELLIQRIIPSLKHHLHLASGTPLPFFPAWLVTPSQGLIFSTTKSHRATQGLCLDLCFSLLRWLWGT